MKPAFVPSVPLLLNSFCRSNVEGRVDNWSDVSRYVDECAFWTETDISHPTLTPVMADGVIEDIGVGRYAPRPEICLMGEATKARERDCPRRFRDMDGAPHRFLKRTGPRTKSCRARST